MNSFNILFFWSCFIQFITHLMFACWPMRRKSLLICKAATNDLIKLELFNNPGGLNMN
jgi:hypothetical protein